MFGESRIAHPAACARGRHYRRHSPLQRPISWATWADKYHAGDLAISRRARRLV